MIANSDTPQQTMGSSSQNIEPTKHAWHKSSHVHFIIFSILFSVVAFTSLHDLAIRSWNSAYFTYIPFIPLISAYLLFTERKRIFSQMRSVGLPEIFIAVLGMVCFMIFVPQKEMMDDSSFRLINVILVLLIWQGGFICCYGFSAFRRALFPLMFLFFAVPIPQGALESIITFLQKGSAEAAYGLIKLGGVPVARDGVVFHLPSMSIEVAPECSGIRSALSLVVTGALAGYFFLKKGWSRAILIITLLPITILKNGFRIASLTLFGFYVDPRILDSDLHRKGGVLFFILALIMTGVVIVMLRKLEKGDLPDEHNADHI